MNPIIRALFFVSTVLLFGCSEGLQYENIYGTYIGNYAGGVETLIIKDDGTYQQSFSADGVTIYKVSEKYQQKDNDRITFYNFKSLFDYSSGKFLPPQKAHPVQSLTAYFVAGLRTLVISEDYKYILVRDSEDNKP